MSCKSPKVKFDEKKKEILSAIKEGKLCTTAEPPFKLFFIYHIWDVLLKLELRTNGNELYTIRQG